MEFQALRITVAETERWSVEQRLDHARRVGGRPSHIVADDEGVEWIEYPMLPHFEAVAAFAKTPEATKDKVRDRLRIAHKRYARSQFMNHGVWDTRAVRDYVRYGGLDPRVAERWAKIYGHPAFVDPESQIGANELAKSRWSLMLGVFYLANRGDTAATACDWTAFSLAWREGTWNGRDDLRQEAEQALWAALRAGRVQAYANLAEGYKSIEAIEWDTLEWRDTGLPQIVGHPSGTKSYYCVTVNAVELQKLCPFASPAVLASTSTIKAETLFKNKLVRIMAASPGSPIPKAEIERRFPEIGKNALNRAWKQAAIEADAPAWSAAGKRSSKPL